MNKKSFETSRFIDQIHKLNCYIFIVVNSVEANFYDIHKTKKKQANMTKNISTLEWCNVKLLHKKIQN